MTWAERSSKGSWRTTCASLRHNARFGLALPFVITYGGRLVGQISVSNIVRGALRGANVGYWVDAEVAGRNIAPTALAMVIDHSFGAAGLHRLEVDIRPENAASLRVAEKLGLRREGYYERFLDIDRGWRDHVAFAVTAEELTGTRMVARLPGLPVPPG
jgi:ribosomal-protein-alanine N-acetyltransferase